jgi:hypothetical protein
VGCETIAIPTFGGPPRERALAELAQRQWGVVTLAQLRALGLGDGAVKHRVRLGRLHRLHRGVYAVGHRALERRGRWLAAVLACGPHAALSHVTAAAHWDLLHSAQTRIDVTSPRGRRGGDGIRLHRTRSLDARDTTTHESIRVTTVARTLLDLAATEPPRRVERAFAQAQRLRIYNHAEVLDLLARTNGHRGTAVLARVTAQEPRWTRNGFEARFLSLIRAAGLPEPLVNEPFEAPDHGPCEPDFHWPSHRLIVETDGWETHGTRAAFEADRATDAALTASGYRVVRFTPRTDPHVALRRVRVLLLSAKSRPRSGSPGR